MAVNQWFAPFWDKDFPCRRCRPRPSDADECLRRRARARPLMRPPPPLPAPPAAGSGRNRFGSDPARAETGLDRNRRSGPRTGIGARGGLVRLSANPKSKKRTEIGSLPIRKGNSNICSLALCPALGEFESSLWDLVSRAADSPSRISESPFYRISELPIRVAFPSRLCAGLGLVASPWQRQSAPNGPGASKGAFLIVLYVTCVISWSWQGVFYCRGDIQSSSKIFRHAKVNRVSMGLPRECQPRSESLKKELTNLQTAVESLRKELIRLKARATADATI